MGYTKTWWYITQYHINSLQTLTGKTVNWQPATGRCWRFCLACWVWRKRTYKLSSSSGRSTSGATSLTFLSSMPRPRRTDMPWPRLCTPEHSPGWWTTSTSAQTLAKIKPGEWSGRCIQYRISLIIVSLPEPFSLFCVTVFHSVFPTMCLTQNLFTLV